jgi:hypothetical protein
MYTIYIHGATPALVFCIIFFRSSMKRVRSSDIFLRCRRNFLFGATALIFTSLINNKILYRPARGIKQQAMDQLPYTSPRGEVLVFDYPAAEAPAPPTSQDGLAPWRAELDARIAAWQQDVRRAVEAIGGQMLAEKPLQFIVLVPV